MPSCEQRLNFYTKVDNSVVIGDTRVSTQRGYSAIFSLNAAKDLREHTGSTTSDHLRSTAQLL